MRIIKSKQFLKDYKKKIKNQKDAERLENITMLLISAPNMKEVVLSPYKNIYKKKKKKGNLKEFYTARINQKIRLFIKPVGEYPYNIIDIIELEFVSIDDSHYGEG